jgi:hypothetical protein
VRWAAVPVAVWAVLRGFETFVDFYVRWRSYGPRSGSAWHPDSGAAWGGDAMSECFCGELVAHLDGWVHVETGSRECFPDEPETDDQALPVL